MVPAGETSVFRWFPEALFRLTDVRIGGHADLRLSYVTVGTIMLARFSLDTPIAYQKMPITVLVENQARARTSALSRWRGTTRRRFAPSSWPTG